MPALEVVSHWLDEQGRARVSGLRHAGDRWEARLDAQLVGTLAELAAPFPVLCFHPDAPRLVSGPAEERRRALDWLVFHVEPDFASVARRYSRALKQRNALLRASASDAEFEPWESEMSLCASVMVRQRDAALSAWAPHLAELWPRLAVSASAPALSLRHGWRVGEAGLDDWLLLNRERDRSLGYTTIGPQRADVDLGLPFGVEASHLSRGQAKLLALALVLSQAEALRVIGGQRALLLLDDLQAELDAEHQQVVLGWVEASGYQALVTGTSVTAPNHALTPHWRVFHVEQGRVGLVDGGIGLTDLL
jgi:DNA replication and repair protein RecF